LGPNPRVLNSKSGGQTMMNNGRSARTPGRYTASIRRRFVVIALTVGCVLVVSSIVLSPSHVQAFVPTDLRAFFLTNPTDETHESITKSAIKDLDNELF